MQNINQEKWEELTSNDDNAVILDVRTPGECAEGIIPNAIEMNIQNTGKFISDIAQLDPSKTYYIYCRSGGRSGQACMLMDVKGFTTFNLEGGMMSWTGKTIQK